MAMRANVMWVGLAAAAGLSVVGCDAVLGLHGDSYLGDAAELGDGGGNDTAGDTAVALDTGVRSDAEADAADVQTDVQTDGDTAEPTDAPDDGDAAGDVPVTATAPVTLGTAGRYVILAKSGVSNVPTSAITGDVGLSPSAASFITGFSLVADASNVFATSTQVTGSIFAADYAPPTPTNLTTAVSDMELAFTDASGRPPKTSELGAGSIGGMTLTTGVYRWGTGLLVPTDVTLSGTSTDVFILQVAGDLTVSSATKVVVTGGALPENVFWAVAGVVDVGTTAHLEGVVLARTAITLHTGASVNGRLLAQTAVSLDGSTVVAPAK